MKTKIFICSALFCCSTSLFAQEKNQPEPFQYPFGEIGSTPRGIFGNDDRKEVKDADGIKDFVRATAAMVSKNVIDGNELVGYTLREMLTDRFETENFDANVRYLDQPTVANCTGFLIAPDVLITAGHCVKTLEDAQRWIWVFDYTNELKYDEYYKYIEVPENNMYEVVDVLASVLDDDTNQDYAVLKLDRKSERAPYRFRTSGEVSKNSRVNTIGTPTGLPLKFSENAIVVSNEEEQFFKSDIDAFPGNSGGPVFDPNGFIEGILVRGATQYSNGTYSGDYKYDPECDCVKTVQFSSAENNAGCQAHKIHKLPGEILIMAVYENLEYAIKNGLADRFSSWSSYSWIYNHAYTNIQGRLELLAARNKEYDMLQSILAMTNDALSPVDGYKLMKEAIDSQDDNLLKILLENSIYPDVTYDNLPTPIQLAVKNNFTKGIRLLLDAGADKTVKDSNGNNLLHLAAQIGDMALLQLLVKHGVLVDEKNYEGDYPEKIAKNADFKSNYKYLKNVRKGKL